MNEKKRNRFKFSFIILLALIVGLISYPSALKFWPTGQSALDSLKINLGLDLQGGIHLEYKADVSELDEEKREEALQAAQDVIERRINAFGVGEPVVQTATSGDEHRIIVELPGIKDINEAKDTIKETPFLEFREERDENDESVQQILNTFNEQAEKQAKEALEKAKSGENFEELVNQYSQDPGTKDLRGDLGFVKKGEFVPEFDQVLFESNLDNGEVYPQLVETQFGWHIIKKIDERGEGEDKEVHAKHILLRKYTIDAFPDLKYKPTDLTGRNLETAEVVFQNQGLSEPQISLKFDNEGAELFADITKRNLGKTVAIYLDDEIVSAPTVQSEISNGEAVITGNFSIEEAKELKGRLNEGALPVPITLISQQSVEASLGIKSLESSLIAGMWGLLAVIIFMIAYYRYFGLVASISLLIYSGIMVSVFKLSGLLSPWPITLTLSGIAGFILSIGMAVDANILIFERIKEELKMGRSLRGSIDEGFKRAWPSIRDGNSSTLITSAILIWIGTGFVKGFAIILAIGILISMFTAIVITKTLISFTIGDWIEKRLWLIKR